MGARVKTPVTLAERFLRAVGAIRPLHSLLDTWTWGDMPEVWDTEGEGGSYPFSEIRTDMVRAINRNMNTGEEAVPDPFYGYQMVIITDLTQPNSQVVCRSAPERASRAARRFRPSSIPRNCGSGWIRTRR